LELQAEVRSESSLQLLRKKRSRGGEPVDGHEGRGRTKDEDDYYGEDDDDDSIGDEDEDFDIEREKQAKRRTNRRNSEIAPHGGDKGGPGKKKGDRDGDDSKKVFESDDEYDFLDVEGRRKPKRMKVEEKTREKELEVEPGRSSSKYYFCISDSSPESESESEDEEKPVLVIPKANYDIPAHLHSKTTLTLI
jgi:hypothetical protein